MTVHSPTTPAASSDLTLGALFNLIAALQQAGQYRPDLTLAAAVELIRRPAHVHR